MSGTSVPQLVDLTASIVQDAPRCRTIQRFLQQAQMLPARPRSHGAPTVEAIHATAWLLGILWTGPNTHAPLGVLGAYHLNPRPGSEFRHPAFQRGLRLERHSDPDERMASFGELLCHLIDVAACGAEGRTWVLDTFAVVELADDGQLGVLHRRDGRRDEFFSPLKPARASPDGKGPLIQTSTAARSEFLAILAELVARTRANAARLNVTVNIEDALRALGVEPPSPFDPDSAPAPDSASLEVSDQEVRADGPDSPEARTRGWLTSASADEAHPTDNGAHSAGAGAGAQASRAGGADRNLETGEDGHGPDAADRVSRAA